MGLGYRLQGGEVNNFRRGLTQVPAPPGFPFGGPGWFERSDMGETPATDYAGARKVAEQVLACVGNANDNATGLANLCRAFLELDEKRQNTAPRDYPTSRFSLAIEQWDHGYVIAQGRAIDHGRKHAVDRMMTTQDIVRGSINLPVFELENVLVAVGRATPGNKCLRWFMDFVKRGT